MSARDTQRERPNAAAGRRWGSCALLALLAAGCDLPGKPNPANREVRPSEVKDFGKLYARNCSGCHGKEGYLGPAPPLNDELFRAIVPQAELVKTIAGGRPGTPMPAFSHAKGGHLTDEQVAILAKGIKQHWGPSPDPPEGVPPYLAPAGQPGGQPPGNKEAGLKVFAAACAECHGKDGRDERLRINDWAFLALSSDQVLRRIIITGRPHLRMPNYANRSGREMDFKPLTSKDVADLVALLASWRQDGSAKGK